MVNVAILVDGQRPIGARARRIPEPHLRLCSTSGPRGLALQTQLTCHSLSDMQDYCQPQAPGDRHNKAARGMVSCGCG